MHLDCLPGRESLDLRNYIGPLSLVCPRPRMFLSQRPGKELSAWSYLERKHLLSHKLVYAQIPHNLPAGHNDTNRFVILITFSNSSEGKPGKNP